MASTVDAAVLFSESSVQDAEAIVPLESSIVSPVLASYVSHNRAPLVTLVVPLVEEPSITLAPVVSKTSGARLSFSRSSHFLNYLFVPL